MEILTTVNDQASQPLHSLFKVYHANPNQFFQNKIM